MFAPLAIALTRTLSCDFSDFGRRTTEAKAAWLYQIAPEYLNEGPRSSQEVTMHPRMVPTNWPCDVDHMRYSPAIGLPPLVMRSNRPSGAK